MKDKILLSGLMLIALDTPLQADIDKALSIVRSTAGVTSVKNQITVKPAN